MEKTYALKKLRAYLIELQSTVDKMVTLYEARPELNDEADIQEVVPMSLDEWQVQLDATIVALEVEIDEAEAVKS